MSYNTKNYTEQGGEVTHIGGKLKFDNGAVVEGLPSAALPAATASQKGAVKVGEGLEVAADGTISGKHPQFCYRQDSPASAVEREFVFGMTWADFVESEYNTGTSATKFSIEDGYVAYNSLLFLENPLTGSGKIPSTQKVYPLVYTTLTNG